MDMNAPTLDRFYIYLTDNVEPVLAIPTDHPGRIMRDPVLLLRYAACCFFGCEGELRADEEGKDGEGEKAVEEQAGGNEGEYEVKLTDSKSVEKKMEETVKELAGQGELPKIDEAEENWTKITVMMEVELEVRRRNKGKGKAMAEGQAENRERQVRLLARHWRFYPPDPESVRIVDLELLKNKTHEPTIEKPTQTLKEAVSERDRSLCVITSQDVVHGCHIIPHSKGLKYLQKLHLWLEDKKLPQHINDRENGLLMDPTNHTRFDRGLIGVIYTPRYGVDVDDVLRLPGDQGRGEPFRFTSHYRKITNPIPILSFDLKLPETQDQEGWPLGWPPADLWCFLYGVYVGLQYGTETAMEMYRKIRHNYYEEQVEDDTVEYGIVRDDTVEDDKVEDDTMKDDTVEDDTVVDDTMKEGGSKKRKREEWDAEEEAEAAAEKVAEEKEKQPKAKRLKRRKKR